MPLHEIGGGCADGDDQVGRLINVERTKILDKWGV